MKGSAEETWEHRSLRRKKRVLEVRLPSLKVVHKELEETALHLSTAAVLLNFRNRSLEENSSRI